MMSINHNRLRQHIEAEVESLRATLTVYARRGGLPDADDLLQDVVVEALRHADRLDPQRPIRAWLLGIAANLVRRQQVDRTRREQREPLVRDLFPRWQTEDDDVFDRVAALTDSPDDGAADALLRLVTPADREVLRLAILHDMNGDELGKALRVKPGTARVRLHRALQRLRQAYEEANHESA